LRRRDAPKRIPRRHLTVPALRVAGGCLLRSAQEATWREDNRRLSNSEQVTRVAGLAMKTKAPPDFTGYWQRHIEA
jgi:hypothetical protein